MNKKLITLTALLLGFLWSVQAAVYDAGSYSTLNSYLSSTSDYQGDTIRISANISITNYVNVYGTKTLDLNGHNLTAPSYAFYLQSGSQMTIMGNLTDTICSPTYVIVLSNAELIIEGGTISVDPTNVYRRGAISTTTTSGADHSSIQMKGGLVDCDGKMAVILKRYDELVMTGGTLRGLNAASGSSVLLKAGTIESSGTAYYYTHPGSSLSTDLAAGSVATLDGVLMETESLTNDTYSQLIEVSALNEDLHLLVAKPDVATHGTVTGTGLYDDGASATLTATPIEGYRFVRWSDGNTDNPRTLTVNADMTLLAIFEYDITLSWNESVAHWTAIPDASAYYVTLYKDNTAVSVSGSIRPGDVGNVLQYNMQNLIEGAGNGVYTFTVTPYIDGSLATASAPAPTKEFIVWQVYTATFISNGGSAVASEDVVEGQTVTQPANPTKDGCVFLGWYSDEALTQEYDFASVVTGNLTLYAKWRDKVSSITTLAWDGYKATWNAVDDVVRYWVKLYKDGTAIGYEMVYVTEYNWESIILNAGNGTYTFTVVVEISGVGELPESFLSEEKVVKVNPVVRFVDWDGTLLKVEEVQAGTGVTPPNNPSRVGYTFIGWDKPYDNITEDITITAQYEINKYTITWLNYDGTELEVDEAVEYGTTPTYDGETPVKESTHDAHYTFSSWSPEIEAVNKDATYTARFTGIDRVYYNVTFVDFDETELKVAEVESGNAATAPADPEREGYTFTGWDKAFDNVTEEMTVTAQYEINTFVVTLIAENGTIAVSENIALEAVPYGTVLHLTATPDDNYQFTGWSDNYNPETGLTVTENVTITASFELKEVEDGLDKILFNAVSAQKIMVDGQLYILRKDALYDARGTRVK